MQTQSIQPCARALRRAAANAILVIVAMFGRTAAASAQTDFYNTDAGRPIRTEDAYPVERRAVELQLAPLRLERASGGLYTWALEPEIAVGALPQTQIEIGLPLAFADAGVGRTTSTSGAAGLEISALYNLNVETTLPALAIAGDALLPVGGLAPDHALTFVKGIVTKTFPFARFHVNGAYTFGAEPQLGLPNVLELWRWFGSLAVDHTLPLRSLLLTAEVVTEQPIQDEEDVRWAVGGGARWQRSPRWALDAGLGRWFTGADQTWYATFGGAYAFGLPWRGRGR